MKDLLNESFNNMFKSLDESYEDEDGVWSNDSEEAMEDLYKSLEDLNTRIDDLEPLSNDIPFKEIDSITGDIELLHSKVAKLINKYKNKK